VSNELMKRALCSLLVLAACTDDGPSGGAVTGTTHVATYWLPATTPPRIDVLFVIDDTTAMAAHQQPLAALPAQIAELINGSYGVAANYQIGVATTDAATNGALRSASAINGAFIVHDNTYTGPKSNYVGSLASALSSLWPSSAATTASNQPLATMRAALDNNVANAGFLREDAYLGVVTISASDDASLGAITDYASFLTGTKTQPTNVIMSGVIPTSASRLSAFHAQFPNRNTVESIDASDYASAFSIFTQIYKTTLSYACNQEPADLDPDLPGPQYDCSFVSLSTIDGRTETLLPPCKGGDTAPCWEIVIADAGICVDPDARAHLQTRGFTTSPSAYGDPFHPEVRGQCIVN
jgi:hypothetical protein